MEISFFTENREYLRVRASVPVRFRFRSDRLDPSVTEETWAGTTQDLSGGGILLCGPVPEEGWIPDLLIEKIRLEVSIYLPDGGDRPVEALARAAWVDTGEAHDLRHCSLGLKFVEISRENQDRIFQYILHDLLP